MGYGKITAKQQEILDYIKDEILKRGYPPTVREICDFYLVDTGEKSIEKLVEAMGLENEYRRKFR